MSTLVAPSVANKVQKAVSKQDVLQLIPQLEIEPFFIWRHLDRERIVGLIGDRGGGKSAGSSTMGLVDFMLEGKPLWSNMLIACDIEIDDETAQRYELNCGGVAHYKSQPLDKLALLNLDERYMNGCLVIEEINVDFANARRSMSNTNIDFDMVCQQLRKFKTSLVYNVIDEMFIDVQLRTLTDIMIKTYDTAFDLDALERKKPAGVDFKWSIYPLSAYLVGEQNKFAVTKKPLPPVYFNFAPWHGIYDSTRYQKSEVYSMSRALKAKLMVKSSPEMEAEIEKWAWLEAAIRELADAGRGVISRSELWQYLKVHEKGLSINRVGQELPRFGIVPHGRESYQLQPRALGGVRELQPA